MKLRITELCKEKGVTLQIIADKMNVSRQSIANTLTKNNPTLDTLEKLANALNVQVIDLFEQSGRDGISGYIEINGVISKIKSKEDLLRLVDQLQNK